MAAAVLLAACGDTGASLVGLERLSEAESEALAAQFAVLGFNSVDDQVPAGSPAGVAGALGVPITISSTFSVSHPCPVGGSIAVDGSVEGNFETDTRAAEVDIETTTVHQSCQFDAEDVRVTVDGNPNLVTTVHLAAIDDVATGLQTASLRGGFSWVTADGREGACSIDVQSVVDPAAMTQTTSGTICGHQFSVTEEWHPES